MPEGEQDAGGDQGDQPIAEIDGEELEGTPS